MPPSDRRPGRPASPPLTHVRCSAGLALLALWVFGTFGCGRSPVEVNSAGPLSSTPAAAVTPASAAPLPERYETTLERRGGRLRIAPAPASYSPKMSRDQAFQVFKAQGVFPETAGREKADVRLGLYTSDQMNPTWPAFYLDQPAWVIRYDDVPAEANRALGSTSAAQHVTAEDGPVNILVFVDADTGRYLNAVQDPVTVG